MNFEAAKNTIIQELNLEFGGGIALVEGQTLFKEYGWVFFYNTVEYIESKDPQVALMSNTPILLTKDGKMHYLNMSCPVDEAVEKLEIELGLI